MKPKRYIEFRIETAENMDRNKVVLLTHPEHVKMLGRLLYKLQKELDKHEED